MFINYDSPARKHKQEILAKKNVANTEHGEIIGTEYELLKLKFAEDKRALKALQSVKAKIELKAGLLPHYDAWIDATLTEGNGQKDNLLAMLMIWHIDVGNLARGLDIGEYMLQHDMTAPDTHARTLATIIAEEVADTAKRLSNEEVEFDEGQVLRASTITAESDMPDQVRSKLARIVAELTEAYDPATALQNYKLALQYNEKAGVKTKIKALEKQLEQDTDTQKDESQ